MNWNSQMKLTYISVLVGVILVIVGVPIYFKYFNKAPSCFDGKMNQDEKGVDCGGSCALLCPDESRMPSVSFDRLFKVGPGAYTALALVENPNQGEGLNQQVFARELNYVFRIYDKNNILLFEVPGTTFVPPGRTFPIFEHSILTGNREADKAVFQIVDQNIPWQKGVFNEPDLVVSNVVSDTVDTRSRIEADIVNREVYPIKNLQVIVVVYDEEGNARESSATVVDYISPSDSSHVSFTWNYKFDFTPSKIDIIPRSVPREWSR